MRAEELRRERAKRERRRRAVGTVVIAAALIVLTPCVKEVPMDTRQSAQEAVARGALLLDVRTPAEFADGHIPGAVNIPVQELAQRAGELPDRDRQIVVYCRSGRRSADAARWLEQRGHGRVIDLGGMSNWPAEAAPAQR